MNHKVCFNRLTAGMILTAVLLLLNIGQMRGQQIAVKTNVLMLGALTPNLGCEVVTGEHTSVDLSAFGHKNPYGITSALAGFQPEFKFWFNGRPMTREYVGVGMLLTTYDITWKKSVYDGDAIGIVVTGGYVFSLGRRWNLELSGSFGFVGFRQKQYYVNDNYDDYFVDEGTRTNSWGYKMFPIELGVSFCYIIK